MLQGKGEGNQTGLPLPNTNRYIPMQTAPLAPASAEPLLGSTALTEEPLALDRWTSQCAAADWRRGATGQWIQPGAAGLVRRRGSLLEAV